MTLFSLFLFSMQNPLDFIINLSHPTFFNPLKNLFIWELFKAYNKLRNANIQGTLSYYFPTFSYD